MTRPKLRFAETPCDACIEAGANGCSRCMIPVPEPWEEFLIEAEGPAGRYPACGLCGDTGVVDTTGNARTPRGAHAGMRGYCICPNGRATKARVVAPEGGWPRHGESVIEGQRRWVK